MAGDNLLAPHVVLLGEALLPLLRKVEAQLSEPVRPIGTGESFLAVADRTLAQFGESVERLTAEANGALNGIVGAADVPESEVHRAVGRLEMVLDELLASYTDLREARPHAGQERGQDLLVAALRHALTEIQDWLRDVVDTFADPEEVLKRKGLPTSGNVNLQLRLTITSPKELDEFSDWTNKDRKPGCLSGLAAFVAGMFLGGWFLGDDE